MNIGIARFSHESNSFSSFTTTLEDFKVLSGQEIIDHYTDTYTEVAGYIAGAEEFEFTPEPLVAAEATPAGPVTSETYETIVEKILNSLKDSQDLDGLLLSLHGAMVSEEFLHADAETVKRIRKIVGEDFPLAVTHDYHGNIAPEIVEASDALIVYKTNPHVDQKERGLQAASVLSKTIKGEAKPTCSLKKPELIFNIAFHNTSKPPMEPLMREARKIEDKAGVLACSIAAGYQYADVPAMGPSIVVITDDDLGLARKEATRLENMMWDKRDDLFPSIPKPQEAVEEAISCKEQPITLFELGDNIGGGSAGDSTFILDELLKQKAERWAVAIYDPQAVRACQEAGIGKEVTLTVGGKTDDEHGPTLDIEGKVKTLCDGKFEETERRHGGQRYYDQGLTAVVEVGDRFPGTGGLLLVDSSRTTPFSIHQLTSAGIQPEQQKILVAKGAVAPRAAYEPVSERIMEVDTPGATWISRPPSDYSHARKSLYEWSN